MERVRGAMAVAVACILFLLPAAHAGSLEKRAGHAARYIAAKQSKSGAVKTFSVEASTADAVMAFVAAEVGGDAMDKALAFLKKKVKNDKITATGVLSKVIMAVHASGKNPRRFGRTNLVKQLKGMEQGDGRFGDLSFSYVYDQALALLALAAAGVDPSDEAVAYLQDAQCDDGGWQFDAPAGGADDEHCDDGSDFDFNTSDTNTTALALMALALFGTEPLDDGFAYLDGMVDGMHGGWGYTAAFPTTDANSTGLVLQAYAAGGREYPAGARRALKDLQHPRCGKGAGAFAFSWNGDEIGDPDLGATVGAIPGLLGKPFPLEPAEVAPDVPSKRSCG